MIKRARDDSQVAVFVAVFFLVFGFIARVFQLPAFVLLDQLDEVCRLLRLLNEPMSQQFSRRRPLHNTHRVTHAVQKCFQVRVEPMTSQSQVRYSNR